MSDNRYWYRPNTIYDNEGETYRLLFSEFHSGDYYTTTMLNKNGITGKFSDHSFTTVPFENILYPEHVLTPYELSALATDDDLWLSPYPGYLQPRDVNPEYMYLLFDLTRILSDSTIELPINDVDRLLKFLQTTSPFRDNLGVHNFVIELLFNQLRNTKIESYRTDFPSNVWATTNTGSMSLFDYILVLMNALRPRLYGLSTISERPKERHIEPLNKQRDFKR